MHKGFVTYLGSDDFLPGVLVLNESLTTYNTRYGLLILVSEMISSEIIELLDTNGVDFSIVEPIKNPNELFDDKRNYKYTYTKLRIFELFGYSKLVYIDADMMVCANIESLFDHPHFSAVIAGSLLPQNLHWKDLNSGLMVLEPKEQLFNKIMSCIDELPSSDGSDQGFLHSFYKDWPEHQELRLHHKYNVPAGYLDEYCADHGFKFSYSRKIMKTNIAVIHFLGPLKPWNINAKSFKRKTDDKVEQSIILWWDLYEQAINEIKN